MTLEEAKRLADNGDVGAMMALAEYYVEQKDNNEDAIDIAYEYYERAGEAGHLPAIVKVAKSKHLQGKVYIGMVEILGKDLTLSNIESAYIWMHKQKKALEANNFSKDALEQANDMYLDSIVWLSALYLLDNNFNDIMRITENVDAPVAKALRGMALYYFAETNEEYERAFTFLKNAEHSSFWNEKYGKDKVLEILRCQTADRLSFLYRELYGNVDLAYNVLSIMLANTKDFKLRDRIQEDMSHYRQNRRGRYEYIG